MAGKKQNYKDHYYHTYDPAGKIAPIPTVRPSWETSHQRRDNNYRQNEHKHHGLSTSLTVSTTASARSISQDLALEHLPDAIKDDRLWFARDSNPNVNTFFELRVITVFVF